MLQRRQHLWSKRGNIFKNNASAVQDDNADLASLEALLVLHPFIGSNHHVVTSAFSGGDQLTILQVFPTNVLNVDDIMSGNESGKPMIDVIIEENSH